MNILVVTGTGTGVGKTVVTAAVAALASARGEKVAVVKPAQTGVAAGEPGDLGEVQRLAGISDTHELARFPDPLSPEAAARAAGLAPLDLAQAAGAGRLGRAAFGRAAAEGLGPSLGGHFDPAGFRRRHAAAKETM